MASYTKNLELLKKDPKADAEDTFNITTMLNENWEKVDEAMGQKAELDPGGKVPLDQLPDLDFVPNDQKGQPNGVATLDKTGKVPDNQLPPMEYDPSGTAKKAVTDHNTDTTAHSDLREAIGQANKSAETAMQNANAAFACGGGGSGDLGELEDTSLEVGTFTNAGAGWNSYKFREAFDGVPQVVLQAENFSGIVQIKDITATGFLYCLRVLSTGSYYTAAGTAASSAHSAATLVSGTTTTASAVKINYLAVEYGGER